MSNFRHASLLALLGLVGLAVGCATDRQVIAQADQVHGQLKPAMIDDPTLSNYLNTIERRIIDAARQMRNVPESHVKEDPSWMFSDQMRFHFVNSKTINAFTTGGEHMYVYTGLLMECQSEDELAAVLCHEYAHVFARHVQQGMNRQYTALGFALAAGGVGAAIGSQEGKEEAAKYGATGAGLGLAAGQFFNMGFTRDDEAEADKLGFRTYVRAGWDPNKFGDFFKRMIAMGYDGTPEMLSDHPTLKSRVAEAEKRAAGLPAETRNLRRPPVAGPEEFARLKQRAAQLAATLPPDKSMEKAQTLLSAFNSCFTPVAQPTQIQARKELTTEPAADQRSQ